MDTILKEFDWVVKVMGSSTTKQHLETSLKLKDLFYVKHEMTFKKNLTLKYKLESNFWNVIHDKKLEFLSSQLKVI